MVCLVFSGVLVIACAGTERTSTSTYMDEARSGKPVSRDEKSFGLE